MREDAGLGDQEVMPGVGLPPNMNEADADGDGKVREAAAAGVDRGWP